MKTEASSFPAKVWNAIPAIVQRRVSKQCDEARTLREAAYDKILKSAELYFFIQGPPCPDRSTAYICTAIAVCQKLLEKKNKSKKVGTIPFVIITSPFNTDAKDLFEQTVKLAHSTGIQVSLLARDGNTNRDADGHVHILVASAKHLRTALLDERVSLIRAEVLILEEPLWLKSSFYEQLRKSVGSKAIRTVFCGAQPKDENTSVFTKALNKTAPEPLTTIGKDASEYARVKHRWSVYIDTTQMLSALLQAIRSCKDSTIVCVDDNSQLDDVQNYLERTLLPAERKGYRKVLNSDQKVYSRSLKVCRKGNVSLILTNTGSIGGMRWYGATRLLHVGSPSTKEYIALTCRAGYIAMVRTRIVTSHVFLVVSDNMTKASQDIDKIQDLIRSYNCHSQGYRFPVLPNNLRELKTQDQATARAMALKITTFSTARWRVTPESLEETATSRTETEPNGPVANRNDRNSKRSRSEPSRSRSEGRLRKRSKRSPPEASSSAESSEGSESEEESAGSLSGSSSIIDQTPRSHAPVTPTSITRDQEQPSSSRRTHTARTPMPMSPDYAADPAETALSRMQNEPNAQFRARSNSLHSRVVLQQSNLGDAHSTFERRPGADIRLDQRSDTRRYWSPDNNAREAYAGPEDRHPHHRQSYGPEDSNRQSYSGSHWPTRGGYGRSGAERRVTPQQSELPPTFDAHGRPVRLFYSERSRPARESFRELERVPWSEGSTSALPIYYIPQNDSYYQRGDTRFGQRQLHLNGC